MELRFLIAYGLMAGITAATGVAGTIMAKRKAARRRRLRGIKDYDRERSVGR